LVAGDGLAEAEDLTSDQPHDEGDGVATLVVARDGNVDVTEGRVGVAKSNGGEVDIRSLSERLVVLEGISNEQQTGLVVIGLDVVGERTGGETASNHVSSKGLSQLEGSTLGIRDRSLSGGGNNAHIARVLDGDDRAGSQDDLLPGLAQVNDVHTIGTALEDVVAHLNAAVTVSKVDVASQHHLDVFLSEGQSSRELAHGFSERLFSSNEVKTES
jgi:hypothetical protein